MCLFLGTLQAVAGQRGRAEGELAVSPQGAPCRAESMAPPSELLS